MGHFFPSVPESEEAKPAKARKKKAIRKNNWVQKCRFKKKILHFVSKINIEDIEKQAIAQIKQGKLSEVEIIAKLEKSNKRLLKPHLYAKLPDGLVEDILHLRNKKVTLALEQI